MPDRGEARGRGQTDAGGVQAGSQVPVVVAYPLLFSGRNAVPSKHIISEYLLLSKGAGCRAGSQAQKPPCQTCAKKGLRAATAS